MDHTYLQDFKYTHDNPYNERLEKFSHFVLRDQEAEKIQGKWNSEVFTRPNVPLCLEIGSGYGHFMMEYCLKNPEVNFIGLDYRFKRSFQLAKKLDKQGIKNFRYLRAKGERIKFIFAPNELDRIFYFFPDPWPKTRHHKKRLFTDHFLKEAHQVLAPGGEFFIKTDHDDYADWMANVLHKNELFDVTFQTKDLWTEHPDHFLTSFKTKFEKIFIEKHVKIKAFVIKSRKGNNL